MRWAALCLLAAVSCGDDRDTWVLEAPALQPMGPVPVAVPEPIEPAEHRTVVFVEAPDASTTPLRVQAERPVPAAVAEQDVEPVVSEPAAEQSVDDETPTAQEATEEEGELVAMEESDALASESEAATATSVQATPSWLDEFRRAYSDRLVARNDITAAISDPQLGVYVEDHRIVGEELDTPHMRWLGGGDVQVVSPSIEALMIGRNAELYGQTANFTCDAARYSCRTTRASGVGVYYRFAPLGSARAVRLVGVMYFDPTASGAVVNRNIVGFDRVIDRELDVVE